MSASTHAHTYYSLCQRVITSKGSSIKHHNHCLSLYISGCRLYCFYIAKETVNYLSLKNKNCLIKDCWYCQRTWIMKQNLILIMLLLQKTVQGQMLNELPGLYDFIRSFSWSYFSLALFCRLSAIHHVKWTMSDLSAL